MMEFTWRGFRGSIEPHWVVEHSRLKTFRRLLMDRGGLNPHDAQALCEDLVVAAYGIAGNEYVEGLRGRCEAFADAWDQVRARYAEALYTLSPSSRKLPPNLEPAALRPLLDELQAHLEFLTGRDPVRFASDGRPLTAEEVLSGVEHELFTDDPIRRSGDPRVFNTVDQEAARLQQRLQRGGQEWIVELQRAAKPRSKASVKRSALAQARGLAEMDPIFAANGFEAAIIPPGGDRNGPRLTADGIHWLDADSWQVLEWKMLRDDPRFSVLEEQARATPGDPPQFGEAPEAAAGGLTYIDLPEGFESLRFDMHRDAQYFERLKSLGCKGFVWMTDNPGMARAFERVKAELELAGIILIGPE
jgi:hypothetical protein